MSHAAQFAADEHFVVALGDCIITGPVRSSLLKRMIAIHEQVGAAATIAVQQVLPADTSRYGIVALDGPADGASVRLADIVEKPGPQRAPSNLAVCARYVFSPVLFGYLAATAPGHAGEVQLTDAIRAMIAAGLPVLAVPLTTEERRLDVGDFRSYAKAFIRVMLTHPELGPQLRQYAAQLLAEGDAQEPGGLQVGPAPGAKQG